MREERSIDPAASLLGALADEIADRLASRLAPRLAEIVEANPPYDAALTEDGMWTAGRVASHYGVAVHFVYDHADELGCVRLGGGRRARLRFDPEIVRERWPKVGGALPDIVPTRRRSQARPNARRHGAPSRPDLLDFEREA